MSENEIADKLRQFGLFDGMQKVDETVIVDGEKIKLLFKGIDFDITSDGRMLKKLKNGNGYSERLNWGADSIRSRVRETIRNSYYTQRQKQEEMAFA